MIQSICFVLNYYGCFTYCLISFLTCSRQKFTAYLIESATASQKDAIRCDLPACQASATDLKIGIRVAKCPRCRVALYCCKAHAVQHMAEHESLCKELTRICDYPTCKKRADVDVRCRQCNVATYCSKRHREKHASAHESRCAELCLYKQKDLYM